MITDLKNVYDEIDKLNANYDILAAVLVGSHLHGYATNNSDYDVVVIYKPKLYNKVMGIKDVSGRLNKLYVKSPNSIELFLYPVEEFFRKLVNGDIQMVETLFGENILGNTDAWQSISTLRSRVLTPNLVMAVVGYALNSAEIFDGVDDILKVASDKHNASNLAHSHRALLEVFRLHASGDLKFGKEYYDSDAYRAVKSKYFSEQDIITLCDDIGKVADMVIEGIKKRPIRNHITIYSFGPILHDIYGISF